MTTESVRPTRITSKENLNKRFKEMNLSGGDLLLVSHYETGFKNKIVKVIGFLEYHYTNYVGEGSTYVAVTDSPLQYPLILKTDLAGSLATDFDAARAILDMRGFSSIEEYIKTQDVFTLIHIDGSDKPLPGFDSIPVSKSPEKGVRDVVIGSDISVEIPA